MEPTFQTSDTPESRHVLEGQLRECYGRVVYSHKTQNYDLGELAQKHKQAANDIWLIREQYLSLLTDLAMGQKPLEALQSERDKLLASLHNVYAGFPSTTYAAYKKAQEALKRNEDMTFS